MALFDNGPGLPVEDIPGKECWKPLVWGL